ncbi:hypothetical protein [Fodinicurvata sp. EGI_FJ10296]|uniref:hypothetical protein n=1 Tax=Fodinicurvata sp. EGI_FJ10296 TaxID=3231908 RepID=UPI003454606D
MEALPLTPNWSDELTALTREHIEHMLAINPRERMPIHMKNWDDSFGLLLAQVSTPQTLVIVDLRSNKHIQCGAIDKLLDAGWVID